MFRIITVVAALLATSAALADKPVAKIDGPSTGHPGDLIILDARGSVGKKHAEWKVKVDLVSKGETRKKQLESLAQQLMASGEYEPIVRRKAVNDGNFEQIDSGDRLLLTSYPGTYYVTLAVGNDDGLSLVDHEVVITSENPPAPDPVPEPDVTPTPPPGPLPTITLQGAVKSAVAVAVGSETHTEFVKLADSYDKVAQLAEGGGFPTVDQMVKTTGLFTTFSLTKAKNAWASIQATVVNPQLIKLQESGNLSTTLQYAATWREIAKGIREGAGAQPPPGPVEPPKPVEPDPPKPDIRTGGVRVFIRIDEHQVLPPAQEAILTSTLVRQWLDKNTEIMDDGSFAYRFWDKNIVVDPSENPFWKEANEKIKHESLPWLVVSNGKDKSYSGPLPATVAEMLTLLEKYK